MSHESNTYEMSTYRHPLNTVDNLGEKTIGELSASTRGDLILPDHDAYNDARDVWNGLINRYPAIIVRAANSHDVATAIEFSREQNLELSVRGGAHHQAGDAIVDNGLVIDLVDLDSIHIDTDAKIAHIGPGNRAKDVLEATQADGLATPTGSAGCVGMAGTTLGGGVGWIRRKHGLSIDALRSMEVVTADGTVRTVSPEQNEDLYWAMRGGGGQFGIVTNFEFDLYEVGPVVGGLTVFYPIDAAKTVLETYASFDEPEEMSTIVRCGEVPAVPPIPDSLQGESAIGIIGCHIGDVKQAMEVFAPLREITEPLIDATEPVPYSAMHEIGTLMHPWGRKYINRSVFVDELTDQHLDLVIERTDVAPGEMDGVGVWSMGGAVGDSPSAAYAWADKSYLILIEAAWENHHNSAHIEWAHETEQQLREAGGEGAYSGYAGVQEGDWEDWASKIFADSYERLCDLKARYDPAGVFSHGLSVEPATDDVS